MMINNWSNENIVLALHEIGAFKFGSFKLKSGITSPVYIDLRESVSFPPLLKAISDAMWDRVANLEFDRLCGVPYTALPMASYLSVQHNRPMVMRRKEVKDYGTKKAIEGVFSPGHSCLVVEDLITSGLSIFETVTPLEEAGMKVKDIVVFLDRDQGGRQRVEAKGYRLHAVVTMRELLDILVHHGRIDRNTKDSIQEFIKANTHE